MKGKEVDGREEREEGGEVEGREEGEKGKEEKEEGKYS